MLPTFASSAEMKNVSRMIATINILTVDQHPTNLCNVIRAHLSETVNRVRFSASPEIVLVAEYDDFGQRI
jgi:hypothetical protein